MSREELKTIIISRFRQIIRESGMTVEELARQSGVTARTLHSYTGINVADSVPTLFVVVNVCLVLGVSLDWLCGLEQWKQ